MLTRVVHGVCVCVCAGSVCEDGNEACKHMRSQDGSYLVEFIHRENMLLQVILLMSGAHLNAPYIQSLSL